MRRTITMILILATLVIVCLGVGAVSRNAFAAVGVPKVLSYQGRLFDANGNLLGGSGTNYCFRFSIWDATSTGSQLWPAATASIMTVNVQSGVFNVGIGDTSAGGDALTYDFNSTDTVYLNVAVATKVDPLCSGGSEVFENLLPRQRIVASGFALNSNALQGYLPAQSASGTELPVLSAGNLILGGTNPQINATGTNTLTLQGGAGTGNIQFFNAGSFISASGVLVVASSVTGSMLQTTATSSQLMFHGTGTATGTISWTPTISGQLTIPNFATSSDSFALVNFAQTLSNKTLDSPIINTSTINSATINSSTLNLATINTSTLNSPTVLAGMTLIQNVATTGLMIFQNATGTALAINNSPASAQATSTVAITAGANVSGAALLVINYGTGNALQINDSSTAVFTVNGSGNTVVQPSSDTVSAFILASANGTINLLTADTLDNEIKIGNNRAAGAVPTLLGLDEKADAGDPTGFPGAMYYSSSTGEFRCFQAGVWYNCVPTNLQWQQSFLSSRWGDWTPSGITATTMSSTNLATPIANGAAAASGQAEDYYVQWTSSGATGMSAGVTSTFTQTEPRYTPRAATRIRTDATITSRRIWFALSSANLATTNGTGSLATVYFGLVYSTGATSTHWLCASGDGTTGSTMDTGVTVAANTYYDMILDGTTLGQLTCQIATNGGSYVSVTKTTNIPTSTNALGIQNIATELTTTAVVHRIAYTYVGSL